MRLIDIEKRMEEWKHLLGVYYPNLPCQMLHQFILRAPTVDAELVQHAKWVNRHSYTACSNCGFFGYEVWKRCPVCECKMDGEE